MCRVLLLSSSALYGSDLLVWCTDILKGFLSKSNVTKVLFVPYAVKDYDEYAKTFGDALKKMGLESESIHFKPDPVKAVLECQAIFIGGGNTFLLLKTLYDKDLMEPIRQIVKRGVPYVGSSAGTNVGTCSINTTNDMPICYPPTFEALRLVPFNINPHYIDPPVNSTHMGETREKRINEYLLEPTASSVLGLREGTCLLVEGQKAILKGLNSARLFQKDKAPVEYEPESDLSFLL